MKIPSINLFHLLLIVLSTALLQGCVLGNTHDYLGVIPHTHTVISKDLDIVVVDKRPLVLNGKYAPSFTGFQRGGQGYRFEVTTTSGHPLVWDMAEILAQALKNKSQTVQAVGVVPGQQAPAHNQTQMLLEIVVKEWHSDAMTKAALFFDLAVTVSGPGIDIPVEKEFRGVESLGEAFWNVSAFAREKVEQRYVQKLEEILDDPIISAALMNGSLIAH